MLDPLIFAGFGVGVLVGLTGVGGGALMTPLLVLFFGYAPSIAVATDLFFAAITKACGVAVHYRTGTIDTVVLRRLLLGSLPAALAVGVGLGLWQGVSSDTMDQAMREGLGWLLLLSASGILCRKQLHGFGASLRVRQAERFKRWQGLLTVAAGAFIGVCVSLTSVGAGALGAVVLLYLYPFRLQGVRLVGTDLAHAIPLAMAAGAMHWLVGSIDWVLLGALLIGSIPGVLAGVWLSRRASLQWLNTMIAGLLVVSGLKLLTN